MERGALNSKTCGALQEGREPAENGVTAENCFAVQDCRFPCADSYALVSYAIAGREVAE